MNKKELTILHSNDLHADFLQKQEESEKKGGFSRLSGYIEETKKHHPNTLYMIAGDMLQGSMIDSEFFGTTTIQMVNMLKPDVACVGNHEADYGVSHLTFMLPYFQFPVICSNLYLKGLGKRLLKPYELMDVDGIKILVIGVVTKEFLQRAGKDYDLGHYVEYHNPAEEIEKVIFEVGEETDLTIILSHLGNEEDHKLAAELDPELGVDIIIGGHTHTFLKDSQIVNDIIIVQAGTGSSQIGRFDLKLDLDRIGDPITSYSWYLADINETTTHNKNAGLEKKIQKFNRKVTKKYSRKLATLPEEATHPDRQKSTTVGNLFCDLMLQRFPELDIVFMGSGGMRQKTLGPDITKMNLKEMYTYKEALYMVSLTGAEIKTAAKTFLQIASNRPDHMEYYQLSKGCKFVFQKNASAKPEDENQGELIVAMLNDQPIDDQKLYNVGMETFHYKNALKYMNLDMEKITEARPILTLTEDIYNTIAEYLVFNPEADLTLHNEKRSDFQ